MAEQTFRSPNFYEREIDLSAPVVGGPTGVPAAVIGTSNKGPAFVPVTVATFKDFIDVFGNLDPKRFGPYAVNEFLKHRSALTFCRLLGAGANYTAADIATTQTTGRVKNAGFKLEGSAATGDTLGRHVGAVQFLCARHSITADETSGLPMFTDNNSYGSNVANLIRGVVMMASTARLMVTGANLPGTFTATTPIDATLVDSDGKFKLVISSTLGSTFSNDDKLPGIRVFTASFDPTSSDYFAKVLNTNPEKFYEAQHLLYADYAVDSEIASATWAGVLSGSHRTSSTSGEATTTFRQAFGAFDTRFTTPASPWFVTQPFGATEYDLFKFEARDDGEYANQLYKITISNLKASLDDSYQYGTFTVMIRDMNDSDLNAQVIEQFPNCSLDPNADNYVAKIIGDRKLAYNFDSTIDVDKRIVAYGKYQNQSKYVRIVMNDLVERSLIPKTSLPFGFRGIQTLKTSDLLTDSAGLTPRLGGALTGLGSSMSGSLVPPIPFRFKVTKGEIPATTTWPGEPGSTEIASSLYTWGVKFERNTSPRNSNTIAEKNQLIWSLTKFAGIEKLDTLLTGSAVDAQNNNKFTLARVALSQTNINQLTASVGTHMREAAYLRNGVYDQTTYTIYDSVLGNRITLATILAKDTPANFNKFSSYAKFTTFLCGGFDGVNILDKNEARLNDKSTSFDLNGCAETSYVPQGMLSNPAGAGKYNNAVYSYTTAVDIMTDPMVVNQNLLALPGIKETYITDYAMNKVRDYGLGMYVMDIPSYDESGNRLFDDSAVRPDIDVTATQCDTRNIDNNYAATYFPDIYIDDLTNSRRVKVPASIGAFGALAFNDRVAYPWFAPAGFNRAALDFVSNVAVRLNVQDRDRLYDSRINPIATFPRLGFVIYGQKTLQISKSALDHVNVRRLMLEIERIIINISRALIFEQNTPELRAKFVADSSLQLSLIQMQAGIEQFQVVCNETNNTKEDEDMNKLNGRVVVVPTRAIEFIAIDFVITNSGVAFI